jgi:DNA-binding CsgD family transcriptional regulator
MKLIDYFTPISLLVTSILIIVHKQKSNEIKKKFRNKKLIEMDSYEKKEKLRKLLTQRFEISKQMVIINASPVNNPKEQNFLGKINEIFYNEPDADFNWEEFYILLNELYNNFSIKLSRTYPELTKEEIHLCCLMKAGFNTSNICFILSYAPITIRTKKTRIRKKVGITNRGDLNDFLNKLIENN